jgi:hypothetical protein
MKVKVWVVQPIDEPVRPLVSKVYDWLLPAADTVIGLIVGAPSGLPARSNCTS